MDEDGYEEGCAPYEAWFVCEVCKWAGDVVWMTNAEVDYAVCPTCDNEMELVVERR